MVDHIARHFERRHSSWADANRILGGLIIIVFLTAYVGAQIIAVGDTATIGLEMDYTTAIVAGGVAVGSTPSSADSTRSSGPTTFRDC